MPREFVKDGRQFITRCSKRTPSIPPPFLSREKESSWIYFTDVVTATADKREFLRISQAVGMGFLIMGVIGYIVKLSKSKSSPCCLVLHFADGNVERWWCGQGEEEEGMEGGD